MERQEIEIKEVKKTPNQSTKEAPFVKLTDQHFTLNLGISEQKTIWDSKPENIQLAYAKILDIWNKDQKSRNFIKHLSAAFLPVDPFTRLFQVSEDDKEKIKCAIMGFGVIGLKNVSEAVAKFSMTKMMVDAKAYLEKSEESKSEKSKSEESKSEETSIKYSPEQLKTLKDAQAEIPLEVKEIRVGYRSENSDKFLSQDAIIALYHFTSRLKQSQLNFKSPEKLNKPQVNKLSKVGTYGVKENHLDSATVSALEKLKAQMDQNQMDQDQIEQNPATK